MHRMIEITVPPEITAKLRQPIIDNPQVVGFTLLKGASIKPPGDDVLQIHVLNRGTDDVLRLVEQHAGNSSFSVVTSEVASITDPANQKLINNDVDEAMWEEIQTGMRHNGRITPNFLMLMAAGGMIAAVGFVGDLQMQVIAFISASIIAPGLEPVAKLSLGLMMKNRRIVMAGVYSTLAGYAVLMAAAAGVFAILLATHSVEADTFLHDELAIALQDVTLQDFISSVAAAAASILMYLSYRRFVIAGPIIALIIIPAATGAAMYMVLGQWHFAWLLLYRLGVDFFLIVAVGAIFIWLKQHFVHRRKPLG